MKNKPNKIQIATFILMILVIIFTVINFFVVIDFKDKMPNQVDNIITNYLKKTDLYNISSIIDNSVSKKVDSLNIKDGYTPIKGVDYFDGVNGTNSISTNTTIIEKTIEQVPVNGSNGNDGLTPIPRCNISKNRWESRYNTYDLWKVILDENNKPVKCTIDTKE